MGVNVAPGGHAGQDGHDWSTACIDVEQTLMRQFNAERSFTCMTGRRVQRRYQGVYKKKSFLTRFIMWLIFAYTLAMLLAVVFGYVEPDADSDTSDNVLYSVIFVCVVYVFMDVMMVVRWLIYWLLLAVMLTFDITGKIYSLFWLDEKLSAVQASQRNAILVALVIMEVLTVLVAVGLHSVYPALIKLGYVNVMRWWDVQPGRHNNTLTYCPSPFSRTSKRHMVVYSGGLNAAGQPHGYGMWTDTASNGERLTGLWENGVPIGPFRSFEHGSGYCFVNLRIGYCHNRAESGSDASSQVPKHSSDGLHWGVVSAECSVSGGFFRFLPTVCHLSPFNGGAEEPQNATEVLQFLRTPADDVDFKHAIDRTSACSNEWRPSQSFRENSFPVLRATPSTLGIEKEALVFIHGYNCALDYGMSRLAQLLALGDFPPHIHPFVFSWPGGGPLSYFQAIATGTDSERTANDFAAFLKSLRDAGYESVNIIAHSMGARVYFNALRRGLFNDIFARVTVDPADLQRAKMRLSTLTFCNPDYSRDAFVQFGGTYDQSRLFCKHISLYADNMDGALFYAEFFSKKSVWGPLEHSLGRRGYTMRRDNQGRADFDDMVLQELNLSRHIALDAAVVRVNQDRVFAGVKYFAYNDDSEQTAEASTYTEPGRASQYLDMDVIDTTWMDNNVHSIRHNYFNLNPTLVEDLRQSIVGKKRASERPSLLKTMAAENVYIFLVAPSHIKNK